MFKIALIFFFKKIIIYIQLLGYNWVPKDQVPSYRSFFLTDFSVPAWYPVS